MKITVELTAEQWAEILHAAERYDDCGPADSGWQSSALAGACAALYEELSKKGIPGW